MTSRRRFLAGCVAAAAAASLARPALAAIIGSIVRVPDGATIYVRDWGNGPAVVLSHGWPLNCDSWNFHAATLVQAGYRVISFDRRGAGRSSQPAHGYSFDSFADDLEAVLAAADVRDAMLVGFSMGGGEVIRYLTRHGARSQRIRKLVIIGGTSTQLLKAADNPNGIDASVFKEIKDAIRADRKGFFPPFLRDVFYDAAHATSHPVTPQILDRSIIMAMQAGLLPTLACVDAFSAEDFRGELSSIAVPTLLIHGTADIAVPIELTSRQAVKAIKGARLVEYQGGAHGLLVTEHNRIAADLLSFAKA